MSGMLPPAARGGVTLSALQRPRPDERPADLRSRRAGESGAAAPRGDAAAPCAADSRRAAPALAPGSLFAGRFVIVEQIGEGGWARSTRRSTPASTARSPSR